MTTTNSSTGPLTLFNELVLDGRAPDADEFCAQYPECPDLRQRIDDLVGLRSDLHELRARALERAAEEERWQPPAEIGGFRVLGPLGRGGMGRVYLAEQQRPVWYYAIKFMRPHRSSVERFQREAKLAAKLAHPGIAAVRASGIEQGIAYIAGELVHGFSLRELIKAASKSASPGGSTWILNALARVAAGTVAERLAREAGGTATIAGLVRQVAEALGHAHDAGVVHRDVKPSNVMVTFDGTIKLIDFGIALPTDPSETRMTSPGIFVGSVDYAAPEQLAPELSPIGPWTDTYALGITLFELLTRRRPNDAERRDPPALEEVNPAIPKDLALVVQRALRRDPHRRFADGREMADALEVRPTRPDPVAAAGDSPGDERTSMVEVPWLLTPPPSAREVFCHNWRHLRALVEAAPEGSVVIAAFFGDHPVERSLLLAPAAELADRIAIIGRHSRAGLQLEKDPTVSLRHLLAVAHLDAGHTWVRLLDLKTGRGFAIDGIGRSEAVLHDGTLVAQLGSYWLFFLPACSRPWEATAAATWERLTRAAVVDQREESRAARPLGEELDNSDLSRIVLLPAVADVATAVPAETSTAGAVGLLIIRRPSGKVITPVTSAQLERGLLLGRYNRCDIGSRDLWETEEISRVHLLLLAEEERILAIDTASTNGTRLAGLRTPAAILTGRAELKLGGVGVRWDPFR